MKKFHRKLAKLIKSNKYEHIFIDGILLYDDAKLVCMLDKKYFIDLEKEECYRRRLSRNYILEVGVFSF
jgi:uridine kinase